MADVKLDIGLAIEANTKVLADVSKALNSLNKSLSETEKQVKDTEKSATTLTDVFKGSFLAGIAVKGVDLLTDSLKKLGDILVVDGVSAAKEFEQTLQNFNIALSNSGNLTQSFSDSFVQFASTVQSQTGIADDAILRVASTLENVANVSSSNLKQATQAVLDFAAANNLDLDSAARLVGKAFEGNVESLKKYGLEVRKGTTDAQNYANTINALSKFSGTAEAQTNTFAGSIRVASTAFEDLQKEVGFNIVKNDAVIAGIKQLGIEFGIINGQVAANKDLIQLASETFIFLANASIAAANGIDIVYRALVILAHGLNLVIELPALIVTAIVSAMADAAQAVLDFVGISSPALDGFVKDAQALFDAFTLQTKEDIKGITDAATNTTPAIDTISRSLENVRDASKQAFENFNNGITAVGTPIEQQTVKVNHLTEELTKLAILENQRLAQLEKAGKDPSSDKQLNDIRTQIELKQLQIEQEQTLKNQLLEQEGIENRRTKAKQEQARLDEENEKKRVELVKQGNETLKKYEEKDPNKKYQEEIKALEAAQADKLAKEDAYNEAILAKNAENKAKIQEQEIAHQQAIDAINLEFDTARADAQVAKDEALAAKQQKELDDLYARNEVLKQIDDEKNQAEIDANQKKIDKILKSEETAQKVKDKALVKEKKDKQQALDDQLKGFEIFANGLAALRETSSRTLFNIGKKAAIAEAILNASGAILKAYNGLPFPANIAAAAGIAVKTGVEVSKIQQQQFAKGTEFVQGPGGIDNVPALLTRGERVISKQGNEDLTTFLTDNSSQNEILLEISAKLERLSPSVTVEIGGKEIANVIREQTRAGRVIA